MSTGKWADSTTPKTGWTCVDMQVLDSQDFLCDMCEVQLIRYVHIMEHPDFPEKLCVGSICAGNMEEDVPEAVRREHRFKNDLKREAREAAAKAELLAWNARNREYQKRMWALQPWNLSKKGNEYLNLDGFNVVVHPSGTGWGVRIKYARKNFLRLSIQPYSSFIEAKSAALDAVFDAADTRPWEKMG